MAVMSNAVIGHGRETKATFSVPHPKKQALPRRPPWPTGKPSASHRRACTILPRERILSINAEFRLIYIRKYHHAFLKIELALCGKHKCDTCHYHYAPSALYQYYRRAIIAADRLCLSRSRAWASPWFIRAGSGAAILINVFRHWQWRLGLMMIEYISYRRRGLSPCPEK